MADIDLDALKAAALAATQGEWYADADDKDPWVRVYRGHGFSKTMLADSARRRDALFIAIANPATILALVERVERLEAALLKNCGANELRAALDDKDKETER